MEIPASKINIELDDNVKTTVCKGDRRILYDINGTKIYSKTISDACIISEVFKKNIYGFIPNNKETIVVDIGMNIGAVPLYFAGNKNVKKIYGFEPFFETYNQALENIRLNDQYIRDKIKTFNVALSNCNEKRKISYNAEFSGGNTILWGNGKNITEIEVKKASEVIKPILDENKDKFIVFKIDCEGSEYDIFESLEEK